MTQTVITLVLVGDKWRLKTPNGNFFDCFFRGNRTDAVEWARSFVSSWSNWIIKESDDAPQGRISQQTLRSP